MKDIISFLFLFSPFVLFYSCTDKTEKNDLIEKEFTLQKKEIELKAKELALSEKQLKLDSIENTKSQPIQVPNFEPSIKKEGEDLAGNHNLTLQWISWQAPGKVTFTPISKDHYKIKGEQKGRKSNDECQNCFLTIDGTIEKLTPKSLRFTGKIESSIHHIQNGDPCVKEGTFDFISTGSRKYWRCQNMDGCDGVTDYVDIYFQ